MSYARPGSPAPLLRKHPLAGYFLLSYSVSWTGALLVALPSLIQSAAVSSTTAVLMFPAMLAGPSLTGIVLTRVLDGSAGLKGLFRRMRAFTPDLHWYPVLLLPPLLVLITLTLVSRLCSASFRPNHFYLGILFGIPAGFLEEIGWSGFAFPRLQARFGLLKAALLLGVLWGIWHLPVTNYLGAAAPHGAYWVPFSIAFTFVMTAMRVLISWIYANTESVLLTQFMHIGSTGALVVFSPAVTPSQETFWFLIYGCALWGVVGILAALGLLSRKTELIAGSSLRTKS